MSEECFVFFSVSSHYMHFEAITLRLSLVFLQDYCYFIQIHGSALLRKTKGMGYFHCVSHLRVVLSSVTFFIIASMQMH